MRITIAACMLVVLSACSGAPVQEMSDARQAIRAAQAAGAADKAPEELGRAQALIDEAQRRLSRHDYKEAEKHAVQAREEAVRALETARAAGNPAR
jgi:ElaB/YqjD/DUF883 family membrane-anchored ribosome-binding protein